MSLIKIPELVLPCKNISKSSKNKDTKMGEITSPCLTPTAYSNQSAESTDGLGLHIGGSRKLSSLSKHEVFEQLLQTLNGERM